MPASLTFLGVGSGLSPQLGNNSAVLESSLTGDLLLLDCGYTVSPLLAQQGRLRDITHIVLTHVHADHVGGLEFLGFSHHFIYKSRPKLIFASALQDALWDQTLKGGMGASQDLEGKAFEAELSTYFEPVSLSPGTSYRTHGLPDLRFTQVLHVAGKPSYGIFLGEDVYYSGDSRELPPTHGPTGKPLRLLFHDCQLDESPSPVHATLALLRGMPEALRARTWLMHYGAGSERVDVRSLGFAGFVTPGQRFEL